jgi:magnesium-transporting ATPase (P-type)
LLSDPTLYKIGIYDKCFNTYIFWGWYLLAIIEGAFLLFLTMFTLNESTSKPFENKFYHEDEVEISGALTLEGVFIF